MACRGCLGCLLKLLNFLLSLAGLAMLGYGIYLLVEYERSTSDARMSSSVSGSESLIQLSRPLLMGVSLSTSIFDDLPTAWFIYLFIGVGAILFIISCCGCVGAVTRNGCCLTCVSKSPYISLRNAVMCLYNIFDVAYPLGITMVQPLYAPQPAY